MNFLKSGRAPGYRTRARLFLPLGVAIVTMGATGCPREGPQESPGTQPTSQESPDTVSARTIEEVLAEHTPEWMDVHGVEGTGIGLCDGDRCIVVYVSERTPEVEEQIPSAVGGHRVRIEESGPFRAQEPDRG